MHRRLAVLALVFSLAPASPAAAEGFVYDPAVDVPVTLGSGAYLLALVLGQERQPLQDVEVAPPSGIDSWAPLSLDESVADVSDWVLWTTLGGSLAFGYLDGRSQDQGWERALLYVEGLAIIGAVTETAKWAVRRPRPYTFDERTGDPDDDLAFFSGHTSFTGMAAFFTARTIDVAHDTEGWEDVLLYGGAGVLTAGMGALRVGAGKHWPSDVLVGAVIGGTTGWLVAELHREGRHGVTVLPREEGFTVAVTGTW